MRRLQIKHLTVYEYTKSVEFLPHKLLLRPREGHDIRIESSRLEIKPANKVQWHRDVLDNCVAVVSFQEPATVLSFMSEVIVENYQETPLDFLIEKNAVNFPFDYDTTEGPDLAQYRLPTYPGDIPLFQHWISQFWCPGWTLETYVLLDNINKAISERIKYKAREEPGVQSPEQTLSQLTGSCRDMATLFIETCRQIGFAARFVSGYQLTPQSALGNGSTHAWSEIYLPGAGWKGFDSSSGKMVGSQYISVAVSRHPESIPPIAGAFLGDIENIPVMKLKVEVTEIPTE